MKFHSKKHALFIFAFWVKFSISLLLSVGGLAFLWTKVFLLRQDALQLALRQRQSLLPQPVIPFPAPTDRNADQCYFRGEGGLARLEPPSGVFFWGFHIDWSHDLPSRLSERIGFRPAIINTFINMNNTDFQSNMINWMAQQASLTGSMLQITVIPTVPIEQISNRTLLSFSQQMRFVNSMYGAPVLLRYGHEMNGNWLYNYSMRPIEYKRSFVTLAMYIRSLTNMTAMVWCPNVANGYPFIGSGFDSYIPQRNDTTPSRRANFLVLDTNMNGQIDPLDDPYGPFYPGDDWVDWVALSNYNYERDPDTRQTSPISPDAFTNPRSVTSLIGTTAYHAFYDRFSVERQKPFAFSETGSAYVTNLPGNRTAVAPDTNIPNTEIAIKESWWKLILDSAASASNTSTRFRQWKMAVWFEESKVEQSYDDATILVNRDYRITFDTAVKNIFVRDYQTYGSRLPVSNRINYTCSGTVVLR